MIPKGTGIFNRRCLPLFVTPPAGAPAVRLAPSDTFTFAFPQQQNILSPIANEISLRLRTVSPSGVVLTTASPISSDFLSLDIAAGALRLRFDLGSGPTTVTTLGRVRVDDGMWHAVAIVRVQDYVTMVVDGVAFDGFSPGWARTLDARTVVIGNASLDGFSGCVQGVMADSMALTFTAAPLCGTDSCDLGPCEHGVCNPSVSGAGFVCNCFEGYFGSRCTQQTDVCTPQPCENGGFCSAVAGRARCLCPAGVVGARCELGE